MASNVTSGHEYQRHTELEDGAAEKATVSSNPSKDTDEDEEKNFVIGSKAVKRKRFFWWKLPKKYWILAVVGLVVVILIVILLIFLYAVVPAIVQSHVNGVEMSINYVDIKPFSTDPDLESFDVEFSVQVAYHASVSSTLNNAKAKMYYNDQKFGNLEIAKQKFPKGKNNFPIVLVETTKITDFDAFGNVSTALIREQQVTVRADTKVNVHAMGLTFGGINLNRDFTINAFDNFLVPKPIVDNITLTSCNSTGYVIGVNVTLENVSQIGIEGAGKLNLSVFYEQDYLGQALSIGESVAFPRGNVSLGLEIVIPQTNETITAIKGMMGGLLGGSGVLFSVTGDHPYATTAVLLKKAFAALNISMLYTDGLSKVSFAPGCNLTEVVAALF